ncbi:hypothetical protein, partial [Ensifer sp. 4252]|uniref:hypothetical protein n=1 Tax=Ensifer sp. 4252 TaxID=3373915 RepID=UPI003D244913
RLAKARKPALAHHVNRTKSLGKWVLISERPYKLSGTWTSASTAATNSSRFARLSKPLIVARSVLLAVAIRPAFVVQITASVSTRAASMARELAPVVVTQPAVNATTGAAISPSTKPHRMALRVEWSDHVT